MKNIKKAYFDQHLECAAPKRWSKYTTNCVQENSKKLYRSCRCEVEVLDRRTLPLRPRLLDHLDPWCRRGRSEGKKLHRFKLITQQARASKWYNLYDYNRIWIMALSIMNPFKLRTIDCSLQTSANRVPNWRFIVEAISKPLVPIIRSLGFGLMYLSLS